ncbi:MAG: hypothetical protein ACE5D7_07685 [Fidelibacterota bacterium]
MFTLGNTNLLKTKPIALFCSVKCPGDKILQTYDQCLEWRKDGQSIISGFHSPMEKECLRILLKGTQPVIISPARGIWKRIPKKWKPHIDNGRLLLVSKFPETVTRMTSERAIERNKFIIELADSVYTAYADTGGKTERLMKIL